MRQTGAVAVLFRTRFCRFITALTSLDHLHSLSFALSLLLNDESFRSASCLRSLALPHSPARASDDRRSATDPHHVSRRTVLTLFFQRTLISKNLKPGGNGKTVQQTPPSGRRDFWTTSLRSISRWVDCRSMESSLLPSRVRPILFVHISPPTDTDGTFFHRYPNSSRNFHRYKHLLPRCSNWR